MRRGDIWTRIPAAASPPPPDTCDNPTAILSQAFDSTGLSYQSQRDVRDGDFVKAYQSFSFVAGAIVTDLHWVGNRFDVIESQGTITAWTIEFWNDNAGVPGTLAQTAVFSPALANETLLAVFGGFTTYTYSVDILPWFLADAGVQYWVSVQPALEYPPGFGWCTAGAGSSYSVFFGTPQVNDHKLALQITGCVPT